ncbi:DUF169 domain-containing protein [Methanorbis furvi]|uniref:DUF169 domain-containing protein n=1 Tax=Methanorbis furvi TaxID=3028299 RepID=A0AAE4MDX2_9EURY|nr:hypothetical protein [Methanocorpusculaceae archaeon Ag1]
MEGMKSNPNFAAISAVLKDNLDLIGSPVAVRVATSPDQVPAGIQEIEETVRHCRMISLAREGQVFYATDAKHQCGGGAWALGFRAKSESLRTGEHYYKLGKYESISSSRRTMDSVPNLPQETYATIYAPLEKAEFAPSVVLIFAKPKAMLKLAQTVLFRLGGRIYPQFSGIQSVCSDATAYPLLSGKPNFSLGCDGSRKFSGIADEEMVVGLPVEILTEIAESLATVVNAAGSKK